jgi:hypothetical protein
MVPMATPARVKRSQQFDCEIDGLGAMAVCTARMKESGCDTLLTNDDDFKHAVNLKVIQVSDLIP